MTAVGTFTRKGNGKVSEIPVILSDHARKRLREERQKGITRADVVHAVSLMPFYCPSVYRLRSVRSKSGTLFDVIIRDYPTKRKIITIIGKETKA